VAAGEIIEMGEGFGRMAQASQKTGKSTTAAVLDEYDSASRLELAPDRGENLEAGRDEHALGENEVEGAGNRIEIPIVENEIDIGVWPD
jgi:hypothetical protein